MEDGPALVYLSVLKPGNLGAVLADKGGVRVYLPVGKCQKQKKAL